MPGPCMPTPAADRQRAVPYKRVDLPGGGVLMWFDRTDIDRLHSVTDKRDDLPHPAMLEWYDMADITATPPFPGFTAAQRVRAVALDAMELAERIEAQPGVGIDGADDRLAAIEELALQLWAAARGRRPIGWE